MTCPDEEEVPYNTINFVFHWTEMEILNLKQN